MIKTFIYFCLGPVRSCFIKKSTLLLVFLQLGSINAFANQNCDENFTGGYDIVVIAGQSNAVGAGRGSVFENSYYTQPSVLSNICQVGRNLNADRSINIIDGGTRELQHVSYQDDGNHGFGQSFARRYSRHLLQSGRKLLIVPVAKGATSILAWDHLVQNLSGRNDSRYLYANMITRIHKALRQNPENKLVAVLWQQGEADIMAMSGGNSWHLVDHEPLNPNRFFEFHSNVYRNRLLNLHLNLRRRFCENSSECFAFLIGQPVDQWQAWHRPNQAPLSISRAKQRIKRIFFDMEESFNSVSVVRTQGLPSNEDLNDGSGGRGDNYHFSNEGLRLLGHRYFLKLKDYQ